MPRGRNEIERELEAARGELLRLWPPAAEPYNADRAPNAEAHGALERVLALSAELDRLSESDA